MCHLLSFLVSAVVPNKEFLFKGGLALEALKNIKTIVMDKTGTLTQNLMQVYDAKLDESQKNLISEGIATNSYRVSWKRKKEKVSRPE